jgi:hypothetical protein
MHPGLTRRGALGAAAALALASCGDDDAPDDDGRPSGTAAGTLRSLTAFEHATVAAWAAIAERLRGEARDYAAAIRGRELRHVERLSELIRGFGGDPPQGRAAESYAPLFPRMRDEADALAFAADLEARLVRNQLDALQSLPDPGHRRTVMEITAEEAEDLAVVHVLAGARATPAPYVTGTL